MNCCVGCKDNKFLAVMCDAECGHGTTRGGMQLCASCAKKQNACEACGQPLIPPPTDDDLPPRTD